MNSRYISILAGLLFLISCYREPEEVYIPLDRTNWFKFEEGDTILFKHNTSEIDSYILTDIDSFYGHINNKYTWEEILEVNYEGIPSCNNCPITEFHRNSLVVSIHGKIFPSKIEYRNTLPIEYQLGDTTLQKVYKLDNLPVDTPWTVVKSVYYSDVFGVIRYDMYDDRVYELQIE